MVVRTIWEAVTGATPRGVSISRSCKGSYAQSQCGTSSECFCVEANRPSGDRFSQRGWLDCA